MLIASFPCPTSSSRIFHNRHIWYNVRSSFYKCHIAKFSRSPHSNCIFYNLSPRPHSIFITIFLGHLAYLDTCLKYNCPENLPWNHNSPSLSGNIPRFRAYKLYDNSSERLYHASYELIIQQNETIMQCPTLSTETLSTTFLCSTWWMPRQLSKFARWMFPHKYFPSITSERH